MLDKNIPNALITKPPIWITNMAIYDRKTVAFGPFIFQRGKDKILGMELGDGDTYIRLFDGNRYREFKYDSADIQEDKVIFRDGERKFEVRGIELQDAEIFGFNPRRPGLTKEQLINEALRLFQPKV